MAHIVFPLGRMPGILENRRKWGEHNWQHGGHRWSPGGTPGGTEMMWWRSIRPRIHARLPAAAILEIAPGVGRWTRYLLGECERLTAVDVTPECVEICRTRFAGAPASFHVNDGESLPQVPDASLDFAFSLDSLVHVEAPQLGAYLRELARTLVPGGAAFLHHSNLGAYVEAGSGQVAPYVRERHWRAQSVSARTFREACRDAGLSCVTQELINWIGRDADVDRYRIPSSRIPLTDCLSTCVRPPAGVHPAHTTVYLNHTFVDEWRQLIDLAAIYAPDDPDGTSGQDRSGQAGDPVEPQRSWRGALRHRADGYVVALRDPFLHARAGRCPDCRARMIPRGGEWTCDTCRATFHITARGAS